MRHDISFHRLLRRMALPGHPAPVTPCKLHESAKLRRPTHTPLELRGGGGSEVVVALTKVQAGDVASFHGELVVDL